MMVMLLAHTSFAEFSEGQIETDEQAQDNPAADMKVREGCDYTCRITRAAEEMKVKKRCNTLLCRIQRGEEIEVKKRCSGKLCRITRGAEEIEVKKKTTCSKSGFCRITRGEEEMEAEEK